MYPFPGSINNYYSVPSPHSYASVPCPMEYNSKLKPEKL